MIYAVKYYSMDLVDDVGSSMHGLICDSFLLLLVAAVINVNSFIIIINNRQVKKTSYDNNLY